MPGPFDPTLEGKLADLPTPVLLIWGDDDQIVPVEHAEVWDESLPHCAVLVFPGKGHLLFHEDPEAVAAVLAFAEDLP